jgi:hypothetical protein
MDFPQMNSKDGKQFLNQTIGNLFNPASLPILDQLHLHLPELIYEIAHRGLLLEF